MAGVDAINGQSLYFAAAQAAAHQQAKEALKENKTTAVKKPSFSNMLELSKEEAELINDGLPVELAGKTEEEAIVFLKDEVDIAGEELTANPSIEQINNYRKKIGNFMKYVSKNNYEVLTKQRRYRGRPFIDKKTGKPAYYVQIGTINEKLDQLTRDLIYNHSEQINILSRVEEINGLIVDLMAA